MSGEKRFHIVQGMITDKYDSVGVVKIIRKLKVEKSKDLVRVFTAYQTYLLSRNKINDETWIFCIIFIITISVISSDDLGGLQLLFNGLKLVNFNNGQGRFLLKTCSLAIFYNISNNFAITFSRTIPSYLGDSRSRQHLEAHTRCKLR